MGDRKKKAIFKVLKLKPYLWGERNRVFCGAIFLAVGLTIGLYLPMLNRQIFDEALPSKNIRMLLVVGGVVFVMGCVEYAAGSGKSLFFQSVALRITARLRSALFRKLTRISQNQCDELLKGDLQDIIMNDVANLRFLYLDRIVQIGSHMVTAIVAVTLMFVLSSSLGLTCLTFIAVAMICSTIFNKKIHRASTTFTGRRSKLNVGMFEMLSALPLIKACCAEERESRRFHDLTRQLADSSLSMEKTTIMASGLLAMVQNLMPFIIFLFGVLLMIREQLLLGELLAFSMYFGKLRGVVSSFSSLSWQWQRSRPSLERVLSILNMPDEPGGQKINNIKRGVEVSDVSLGRNGLEILRDVSLIMPQGTMAAVVGPNGSGKTTLLKVASGLIVPDRGEVLVDGKPLSELNKRSYRRLCGFLFQNTLLLNRTIRETVCYRTEGLWDDDKVYEVLERVKLREFVRRLPQKLETKVGEMGSHVSGGEMQRLSIARELAYQPRILFLDEATTSIDAKGESQVFEMLRSVCGASAMSVVFVSHYLSTLRFADLIYVMREGQILDSGALDELAENSPLFREIFGKQLKNIHEGFTSTAVSQTQ